MVGLVHEQMQQQIVGALTLDAAGAVDAGFGSKAGLGEFGNEGQQALIDRILRRQQRPDGIERLLRLPGPGPERAALQRVDKTSRWSVYG